MHKITKKIFSIRNGDDFRDAALEVFRMQYEGNIIYRRFTDALNIDPYRVTELHRIPFLPIEFFKTQKIITDNSNPQKIFISSGTTGMERSRHEVTDISLYTESLSRCFEFFYGNPAGYEILALTTSPSESPGSSLDFMIDQLISKSGSNPGNYFTARKKELAALLASDPKPGKKRMLIGLTWALLDFAEAYSCRDPGLIIVETGGMKGRREELTREDLHEQLSRQFGVPQIHSEYGMTELLSQAWSAGKGVFRTPPWMRVLIREPEDPFRILGENETGGINIIDLANLNSCSFISTQDIGRIFPDGSFEVLGRFDFSDIRGCSLMAV